MSKGAKVRASCDLSLVDHATGLPSPPLHSTTEPRMFEYGDLSMFYPQTAMFMDRVELEASPYLRDDRLTIRCAITVVKEPIVFTNESWAEIKVPPSDMAEHIGKLLDAEEGADVTLIVGGETFRAHKMVLAARSPVFKAELCGRMREARTQCVAIEDMQPDVFRALLHFIYTDSLPNIDDLKGNDDYVEMILHLLVAADKYAMERLKLICQDILRKNLDVNNEAITLGLAYGHTCPRLQKVCSDFINSSNTMLEAVAATPGFQNLKRTCPEVLADEFAKKRIRKKAHPN